MYYNEAEGEKPSEENESEPNWQHIHGSFESYPYGDGYYRDHPGSGDKGYFHLRGVRKDKYGRYADNQSESNQTESNEAVQTENGQSDN